MKFLGKIVNFTSALTTLSAAIIAGYLLSPRGTQEAFLTATHDKEATLKKQFLALPTLFEKNLGQFPSDDILFLSKGANHTYWFTHEKVQISFTNPLKKVTPPSTLTLEFVGKDPRSSLVGTDLEESLSHYLVGSDPNLWIRNIPNFSKISYQNLYAGIDAVFYGNQSHIEYDLVLSPESKVEQVALRILGAQNYSLSDAGNLLCTTKDDQTLIMQKPVSYQMVHGEKQLVDSKYVLLAANEGECVFGFSLGAYDKTLPLVIDPVISYSSYVGGVGSASCHGVAVDPEGNAYITGWTATPSAFKTIFVTKINPLGTAVIYTTYLGSGSVFDTGNSIAVDSHGNAYVTGDTNSADFPLVGTNLSPGIAPGSVPTGFVSALTPDGSHFIYSTLLGGSLGSTSHSIAIDPSGNAYVTGSTGSKDFPTKNPLYAVNISNGSGIAFVTAIAPDGSELIYSTYLGGSSYTHGRGIATDKKGNAYVTGLTTDDDFPTINALPVGSVNGYGAVFVTKINPTGSELIYSTYLGNSNLIGVSQGQAIAADAQGNAYVTGVTYDTHFPKKGKNLSPNASARYGVSFITAIHPDKASLIYSSLLGGNQTAAWGPGGNPLFHGTAPMTIGNGISLDRQGNIYLTGQTYCSDFPLKGNSVSETPVPEHGVAFVTSIKKGGKGLLYSTYLGSDGGDIGYSIATSKNGQAYIAGKTYSMTFPSVGTDLYPDLYPGNGVGFITSIAPVTPHK